jgi:hypothetical protein
VHLACACACYDCSLSQCNNPSLSVSLTLSLCVTLFFLSLCPSLCVSLCLSLSLCLAVSLSLLLSLSLFLALTLSLSYSLPFLLSHPNPASLHLINTRNEQEALERANAKAVQDENDAQQERQIELAKLKSQRAKREILNARKKNADIKGQPVESQTAAATASHAKHVSHSTTAPVPVLLVHINLLCVYV